MNIQKELKFHSNPGLRKLVLDNDKIKKKMKNELKKKKKENVPKSVLLVGYVKKKIKK